MGSEWPSKGSGENILLAAIPENERSLLAGELEHIDLEFKKVVQEAEKPIDHVWFPRSGVCSVLSEMEDGTIVEVGTIGREGMVGLPLLLHADQIAHTVIAQIPGEAARISASTFTPMLDRLPMLHRLLLRYTVAFITQVAQGGACNRAHPIEARCARWLLMTHDRVDGDTYPLTHEFLGQMLGVTRPSVSIAAGILQKAGYIAYIRGRVTVLDRPGLEAASCECYELIAREFRRVIGVQGEK